MYDTPTLRARRVVGAIAVAMAVVLASPAALAQPRDKRSVARAKKHFRAGQAAVAKGEYDQAYREFEQGYELSARPLFLFNMGEAARAGGDVERALDAYRRFLAASPKSSLAATARSRIDELDGDDAPDEHPAPAEAAPKPRALDPVTATRDAVDPAEDPARAVPLAPTPNASPRHRDRDAGAARPLWKRWELWASVGAVALLGGGTWYLVSRDGDGPCGAGCSEFDLQ